MNARLFPLRLSRPAARTRRRAFTLLEIMVVMVIIGAVLSIAIPRFGNVFEANIKSAMRRFAGMVKFCFHEAVIKQSVLRLNVDPMTGEYWVAVLVSSGTVGQFVEADESLAARARLPHGIQFVDVVTPHDILKKEREEAFISFFSPPATPNARWCI
ncbi:MAG: prepilin-type N-terminal cleavage/methylation domain-containing protein [Deltaproteobacteria bacterium]|nr:prepilin-type N-terminal cleavage/methylation domain-containing protein [Deltaproteobacteria bacterium]